MCVRGIGSADVSWAGMASQFMGAALHVSWLYKVGGYFRLFISAPLARSSAMS